MSIVSHRNHFHSAATLAEDYIRAFPPEMRESIKPYLVKYTERVIGCVSRDFATAAERGIAECSELLQDPKYYQTLANRRERILERMRLDKEEQKKTQLDRLMDKPGGRA